MNTFFKDESYKPGNYYYCSDGSRVSEAVIQKRYSDSLKKKHEGRQSVMCECCGVRQAVHNDHTIARARCKVIRKTELIWNPNNYVSSCAQCHAAWENFKSGEWTLHLNVEARLLFLKTHDFEGYLIRVNFTMSELQAELEKKVEDQLDKLIEKNTQQNDHRTTGLSH